MSTCNRLAANFTPEQLQFPPITALTVRTDERCQVLVADDHGWVHDIFIACVDALKGVPEAIGTIFPITAMQLCIVHMVKYSYVSWKLRKEAAVDLRAIYIAATAEEAGQKLDV